MQQFDVLGNIAPSAGRKKLGLSLGFKGGVSVVVAYKYQLTTRTPPPTIAIVQRTHGLASHSFGHTSGQLVSTIPAQRHALWSLHTVMCTEYGGGRWHGNPGNAKTKFGGLVT